MKLLFRFKAAILKSKMAAMHGGLEKNAKNVHVKKEGRHPIDNMFLLGFIPSLFKLIL